MKQFNALLIGPGFDVKGGIGRVNKKYSDFGLFDNGIKFLSSYTDKSKLQAVFKFFVCVVMLLFYILFNKDLRIIHVTSSQGASFLRKSIIIMLAKTFNKKTIIHIRGSDFDDFYYKGGFLRKKYISYTLDKADIVLVLSGYWKNFVKKISKNQNIKILYNPVVIQDIDPVKKQLNNPLNILFTGRIGQRKGVYDIIEAVKYIKNLNITINLYGDSEVEKAREVVNSHNLYNIININSWITGEKLEQAYKDADFFILPTYSEGLPNSVLEAISYSLPVISTPVGGIPEIVEDGINGFLVKPGDYITLAEKIDLLSGDRELRNQMGQKSLKIAEEKFDIKVILSQIRQIHKDLLCAE